MFEALQTETYLRYTFYFPEAHDLSELYYKVRQQLLQSATVSYHKIRQPFITMCDSYFIAKCDKCYYKVRQVSQSVTVLLQSMTDITKCDDYYKVRQNTPSLSRCHNIRGKQMPNYFRGKQVMVPVMKQKLKLPL